MGKFYRSRNFLYLKSRGQLWPDMAIRDHPWPVMTIRGQLWPQAHYCRSEFRFGYRKNKGFSWPDMTRYGHS
jgi:hypothetical protein